MSQPRWTAWLLARIRGASNAPLIGALMAEAQRAAVTRAWAPADTPELMWAPKYLELLSRAILAVVAILVFLRLTAQPLTPAGGAAVLVLGSPVAVLAAGVALKARGMTRTGGLVLQFAMWASAVSATFALVGVVTILFSLRYLAAAEDFDVDPELLLAGVVLYSAGPTLPPLIALAWWRLRVRPPPPTAVLWAFSLGYRLMPASTVGALLGLAVLIFTDSFLWALAVGMIVTLGYARVGRVQAWFLRDIAKALEMAPEIASVGAVGLSAAERQRAPSGEMPGIRHLGGAKIVIRAADDEGRRIGDAIHHRINGRLRAIRGLLEEAKDSVNKTHILRGVLEELGEQSTALGRELREITFNLNPQALFDYGIHGGLLSLIDSYGSELPKISLRISEAVQRERFHDDVEMAVYLVVSGALSNVARHADASLVTIEVTERDGRLSVSVRDDGRGFDPEHARLRGLSSLRERVAIVGGELTIDSEPDRYTAVLAVFPALRSEEAIP